MKITILGFHAHYVQLLEHENARAESLDRLRKEKNFDLVKHEENKQAEIQKFKDAFPSWFWDEALAWRKAENVLHSYVSYELSFNGSDENFDQDKKKYGFGRVNSKFEVIPGKIPTNWIVQLSAIAEENDYQDEKRLSISLNYFPITGRPVSDVVPYVKRWVEAREKALNVQAKDAKRRYLEEQNARAKAIKARELADLARLKKKYENP